MKLMMKYQLSEQKEKEIDYGVIVPLYHKDILAEYYEVLHRSKFHFKNDTI